MRRKQNSSVGRVPNNKTKNTVSTRRGTGRKGNKRADAIVAEASDREYNRGNSDNAYGWYNRIPQLTADATRLQYSWPTGRPINLGSTAQPYKYMVPGVLVEYLVPTYGFTSTITDPINVMAQQMYAYLRKDQTSTAVFDRQDALIYEFAVAEMYSYIEFLRRTYGLATRASVENAYIPNRLIEAMGIDPADVVTNLSQLRYGINLLIQKASQFAVPNEMTLFSRKVFLYSEVYIEGSSIKDQMYMYSPAGFYVYANDSETKAGMLRYQEFLNTTDLSSLSLYSVKDLLTIGNGMINALMDAGDVSFVSGAIVKTFGNNLISLNLLPEEYFVSPRFDITVLEQMKNATVIPYKAYNKPNLEQNPATNTLIFEPEFDSSKWIESDTPNNNQLKANAIRALQLKKMLQTTTGEVSPAVTMENSRLMVACVQDDSIANTVLNLYCGTEICVNAVMYQNSMTSGSTSNNYGYAAFTHVYPVAVTTDQNFNAGSADGSYTRLLTMLRSGSAFDFKPPCYLLSTFSTADSSGVVGNGYLTYLHDVDNYMVLDDIELRRLHEAALISLVDMRL